MFERPEVEKLKAGKPSSKLEISLRQSGIPRAKVGLSQLTPHLSKLKSTDAIAHLLSRWEQASDREIFPDRVAQFAERFPTWTELTPEGAETLGAILGCSDFLSRYLLRHPEDFSASKAVSHSCEIKDLTALRREKYRAFLGIFSDRQLGKTSISQEWKALSDLADRLSRAALLLVETDPKSGVQLRFLSLGKWGAEELNVSSDIDLLYFIPNAAVKEDAIRAATRMAEQHTRFLSLITEEGFCYRVDARLRPSGQQGPLVQTIPQMERHYESHGRTWERAVWLRARESLPPPENTVNAIQILHPFIFRRHLGYGTIDDLRDMKARIDASTRLNRDAQENIKLGTGGIREIEFITAAYQLIYGGKLTSLQTCGTISVLEELERHKLLKEDTVQTLIRAYSDLRNLEHALQWENERQTHSIPKNSDAEEWHRVQARIPARPGIQEEITQQREKVQEIFEKLFLPERRGEHNPVLGFIF